MCIYVFVNLLYYCATAGSLFTPTSGLWVRNVAYDW